MPPLITLFFDLTANDGWNGVAIATYASLIGLGVCSWMESR